jgi:hypothetical protein
MRRCEQCGNHYDARMFVRSCPHLGLGKDLIAASLEAERTGAMTPPLTDPDLDRALAEVEAALAKVSNIDREEEAGGNAFSYAEDDEGNPDNITITWDQIRTLAASVRRLQQHLETAQRQLRLSDEISLKAEAEVRRLQGRATGGPVADRCTREGCCYAELEQRAKTAEAEARRLQGKLVKVEGSGGVRYMRAQYDSIVDIMHRMEDRAEQAEAALAALQQAQAAEQERAFRAGFEDGVSCVDKYGDTNDTPDEALARWRAQQESKP